MTITQENITYTGVVFRGDRFVCENCGSSRGAEPVMMLDQYDRRVLRYKCRCGNRIQIVEQLAPGWEAEWDGL